MKISVYELLGLVKVNKAPKKIKFIDLIWEYCKEVKDYIHDDLFLFYRMNSIGLTSEQKVEIIEDVKKEPIQDLVRCLPPQEDEKIVSALPTPLKIEKDGINYFIRNEHGTECYLTTNNRIMITKLNQVIEYLERMSK